MSEVEAAFEMLELVRAEVAESGQATPEQATVMVAALEAMRDGWTADLAGRGFTEQEIEATIADALVGVGILAPTRRPS